MIQEIQIANGILQIVLTLFFCIAGFALLAHIITSLISFYKDKPQRKCSHEYNHIERNYGEGSISRDIFICKKCGKIEIV